MSEIQQTPAYTDDQIHGRASITCNRTDGELLSAGHVETPSWPGECLVWAFVACPDHLDSAPC